jgi:acyl-[acyl-carrier-protein]-phospholipid O-acyltransferase/long-chain-fatty-acid--[acyl-carrier-protein] ligase
MSLSLLGSRRFAPLFIRQFLSAFNDNFVKNALVLLILYRIGEAQGAALVSLAGAIFIAPFFLLSALGGELADKYDKAMIARRLSLAEIAISGVAAAGFALSSAAILFVAMFLFGVAAALFGPVKYGILPDHLTREELPAGNALVESATFLAILGGTIAGGFVLHENGATFFAGGVICTALLAYLAARQIPGTRGATPDLRVDGNIFVSTLRLLRLLRDEPVLWRLAGVTSLFWLFGSIAMSLLPQIVAERLHGADGVVTFHLAVFAVAIALGSGVAAFLLDGRIVLLPAVFGAAIIGLAAGDLALAFWLNAAPVGSGPLPPAIYFDQTTAIRAAIDLGLTAFAGGLMIVPAFAAIQAQSPIGERARIVAAVNVHNAAFMALGGLAVAGFQSVETPLAGLLAGLSALAFAAAFWIRKAVVARPFLDALSILFRAFYRLEVIGYENIEKAGPNPIIAVNHVSFLDAAAILSVLPRDPIFAIDQKISETWWVRPFLHFVRAVPLDPTKPLGARALVNAVRGGQPLVIFPEGRLTVTGSLMKVYDGAGMIADKSGSPILPARLEGPEATMFSRLTPAQARRRWFPKFTLTILEPAQLQIDPALKGRARRLTAGSALYRIMSDLVFRTTRVDETLFDAIVSAADRHGLSRIALEDPVAGAISYRRMLVGARALGQQLVEIGAPGEAIGLMTPNAIGFGVAFLALSSAGRAPAMINFTAGPANILAGCRAAKVSTILTSRVFIRKAHLERLIAALEAEVSIVFLEDLRDRVTLSQKLAATLRFRQPLAQRKSEDVAAILFTSGSEGAPKGVALSSRNMLSNAAQASARIDFGRTDKLFNVLPVFHCFGLTIGFVLPMVYGVPVFLYPSPLHYRIVPELVYATNATILFGTDTFLSGYARTANTYDFRSIRYVVAGAEPLKKSTRDVWSEKFGVRIFEGYGVTETSPVLSINTPMFNKFGTVGQLVPGLDYRLESVEGIQTGGRLVVRGPNVMLGYLRTDAPGVLEPPPDGWYDTGDIVVFDAEGYLSIKGRAKRFAKVGGEMVSLAAIEELAGEIWPGVPSAATVIPDPRKGERIILATQSREATRVDFIARIKSKGLSELSIPSEVVFIEDLPLLGSGKIDFAGVAKLLRESGAQSPPSA